MNVVALIIQLVSGAVGGNLAGNVMKDKSLVGAVRGAIQKTA